MNSSIILHRGRYVPKLTQLGKKIVSPVACIGDDFTGVFIWDTSNEYVSGASDGNSRSLLAPIRGLYFAKELNYFDEDLIYSCVCAGMNKRDVDQEFRAKLIYNEVGSEKRKRILNFVPKNIYGIIEDLVESKVIFDGDEIKEEIRSGRIKNSEELEWLIEENEKYAEVIDNFEYGGIISFSKMMSILKEINVANVVYRALLDEYLLMANKQSMKILSYIDAGSSNVVAFSKMKSDDNIEIDFHFSSGTGVLGEAGADIQQFYWIQSSLNWLRSPGEIDLKIHNKAELEALYGTDTKFKLSHKLPILFRDVDAKIYMQEDSIVKEVRSSEFEDILDPIALRIEKNMRLEEIKAYKFNKINSAQIENFSDN
ncbi:MAG: hypothetical protein ACP5N3_04410 [Candidatus Nanoarchaeia archaeon]